MPPYKEMYLTLFNSITHAITILQSAQQQAEELFIEHEGARVRVIKRDEGKESWEREDGEE